jgi:hypothetical protein
MENWSWIEVAWTLVAVIGAYFSARNIIDGLNDLNTLRKLNQNDVLENKILKILAWGNTRRDALREAIQLTFLGLGILVGFRPESSGGISLIGILVQAVFIVCSVFLTLSAMGDHYDRTRVQALGRLIQKRDNGL